MNAAASWMLWELTRTTMLVAILGVSAWIVLRPARIGSPVLHRACCVAVLLAGWTFVRWPVEVAWYEAPEAPAIEQTAVTVEAPQSSSPPIDPALLSPPPELGAPMSLPPEISTEPPPAESPPSLAPAPVVPTPAAALPANWQLPWQQWAIGGWLVGIVAIVSAWLVGYLRFLQKLPGEIDGDAEWAAEFAAVRAEQGGAGDVTLRVTESAGPLLCRTPRGAMLLVPRSMWIALAPHERRAILRHELAHYRRGDLWKSLAVRVLALPHWFNPIAWLAVRRFDDAAEWACDRAAMGEEPTTYAAMLLRLGELASTPARFGSAMSNRPLTNRIRRLLTLETSEDSAMKKAILLSLLLLVTPLALVRVSLVAQQPGDAASLESDRQESGETVTHAPTPPEIPQVAERSVQAAKRRVAEEARNAFLAHNVAYDEGTTLLESVLAWSNRWLAAELAVATTRDEQLAAARKHLERMKKRRAAIKKLNDIGARGGEAIRVFTVDYFVADAERRLAEIEANQAAATSPYMQSELMRPAQPKAQALLRGRAYDLDDPDLVPALKEALQRGNRHDRLLAISLVRIKLPQADGAISERVFPELAPELIDLLGNDDPVIRERAEVALLSIRSSAEGDLTKAAESANPEIAKRAKRLLEQTEPTDAPQPPSGPFRLLSRAAQPAPASSPPVQTPLSTPKPAKTNSQALRSAPEGSSGTGSPYLQILAPAALRYDGKTFDQWTAELQTDLSPTLRKEGMQAMGEFAGHGYGKRVAEVIFETMQGYSISSMDNSPEGHLKLAAVNAAKRVPTVELTPVVSSALASDNVNLQMFALMVMPADAAKDRMVPLLVEAMKDRRTAIMARMNLAVIDHDNPAVVESLRQALRSGELAEIESALRLVCRQEISGPGVERTIIDPYLELAPEAIALLDHPNKVFSGLARSYLRLIGKPLLEPLGKILSTGKASDAARRLYEEIEAMSPPFGDSPVTK